MQEWDDNALLREYAERDSEEAFATLVTRHVGKVYSVALRHTGNTHQAEEITQTVFVILARKVRQLGKRVILEGWLYEAARLTALTAMRGDIRRARREQEAQMQTEVNENETEVWTQIAPLLDAAMAGLNETDRHAVVLRFFYGKSLREVGAALGGSESAATLRVRRALEKLRRFFEKHGVRSTAAVIAGAMAVNSAQAAPTTLAQSITSAAMAKGAAAGGPASALTKGVLKIMAWTKVKTATAAGIALLLAAGAAMSVKKYQIHQAKLNSWRVPQVTVAMLSNTLPQVRILPTKFAAPVYRQIWTAPDSYAGVRAPVSDLARIAYKMSPGRILFPGGVPSERYDFAVTIPEGGEEKLQREIEKTVGLVGRRDTVDTDVMVLKVRTPNAPGLKPHDPARPPNSYNERARIFCIGRPISRPPPALPIGLTKLLEGFVGMPVIDETGLTNLYDIDIRWDPMGATDTNHTAMKEVLAEELGMELVPGRRPVEMLVMEKTDKAR